MNLKDQLQTMANGKNASYSAIAITFWPEKAMRA